MPNNMIKKYTPLEVFAPLSFAFIFIVMLIYSRFEPHVEDVDAAYVKANAGQPGYVLVDTRPAEEYEGKSPRSGIPGGHIPGAVSFPHNDLNIREASEALKRAGITMDKTIIIYCNTGVLSGKFADQLVMHYNFKAAKLKNYRGGIAEWVQNPDNILLPPNHETGVPLTEY